MSGNGDQKKKPPKMGDMKGTVKAESHDHGTTARRFLRSGYLSIQNLIRDKRDEITAATLKKFLCIINEVDEMYHLVKKPREQVSDAEALLNLSDTLMTSIRVHSTGSVTPSVFVSSLISEYGKKRRIGSTESAQILWKDLGLHVSPLFMIFKGSSTMLGHMRPETIQPQVFVKRKRPRKSIKEERVKPEKLEDTVSKAKTQTEKVIMTMFDILRSNTNVGLGNIILNRTSFAQTVENLFALSFLVKDGRVVISVDEKGRHYVSPRNAPAFNTIASGKVAYGHFIFRFDFSDWKLMKGLVAEGSELMPHRTKLDPYQPEPNSKANTNGTTELPSRNFVWVLKKELR